MDNENKLSYELIKQPRKFFFKTPSLHCKSSTNYMIAMNNRMSVLLDSSRRIERPNTDLRGMKQTGKITRAGIEKKTNNKKQINGIKNEWQMNRETRIETNT